MYTLLLTMQFGKRSANASGVAFNHLPRPNTQYYKGGRAKIEAFVTSEFCIPLRYGSYVTPSIKG